MFEQSPFNVEDFAKQRCRWYGTRLGRGASHARSPLYLPLPFTGYAEWLCVKSKNLALWRRLPRRPRRELGAVPLLNIINWMNILLVFSRRCTSVSSSPCSTQSVLWLRAALLFAVEFDNGVANWLMLLLMQVLLIPLYGLRGVRHRARADRSVEEFAPKKKFAAEWFRQKKRPSAQGETAFTG